MSDHVTKAISVLREKGLRITKQRKAILKVLFHADAPISAEENHARLTPSQCDLVTVYRCLEQFVKAGVVELGVRENGTKVYPSNCTCVLKTRYYSAGAHFVNDPRPPSCF